jgi:hypothetical protein
MGGIVPVHHNGLQNGQQRRVFFHHCLLPVALAAAGAIKSMQPPDGGVKRLPVSGLALAMLNWAMHSVLHQPPAMAIKMASGGGALFLIVDFCLNINVAKSTML